MKHRDKMLAEYNAALLGYSPELVEIVAHALSNGRWHLAGDSKRREHRAKAVSLITVIRCWNVNGTPSEPANRLQTASDAET